MARTSETRWRIRKDRAIRTTVHTISHVFRRVRGGWQLPCGCIGPDIMNSNEARQAYCTFCERGWHHMTDRCHMLDGLPQGQPVLVLLHPL